MRQIKLRLMILGVLCTPSILFTQTNNRVSIQTGLFHCFFDGSPILNVNYPLKNNKLDIFNGLFLNSVGLEYSRLITQKSFLAINYLSFRQNYNKHTDTYPIIEPIVGWRYFSTVGLSYSRKMELSTKFDFIYGGGVNFRRGEEAIIISRHPIGSFNGQTVYELWIENIRRNDIGLNTFVGIDYTPVKWLTLSTKIDFLGFVYIHDKEKAKRLKEVYDSPQFPSKYDLSLRFSLGFNFGK